MGKGVAPGPHGASTYWLQEFWKLAFKRWYVHIEMSKNRDKNDSFLEYNTTQYLFNKKVTGRNFWDKHKQTITDWK